MTGSGGPPHNAAGSAPPQTTPAVLNRIDGARPNHDALITDEKTLTFAGLRHEVRRAAGAMVELGVAAGDRVAIWSPNTWHWVVACLAAHHAGAVVVPLNTRYTASEAADILARTGSPLLIAMGEFLGTDWVADLDRSELPALRHIVRVPLDGQDGTWDDFAARGDHAADLAAAADARAAAVQPDDSAVVPVRIDSAAGDPGGPGEVLLRGPNVMLGYLDDPEATSATIDTDGWLHTGDIGNVDAAGNLRITDRLKDMYICGGFNVYPAEIEQVLARLPGVAEAAVIGVPDERLGEVGKAFIVRLPGSDLDERAVIAYSREHLANFKLPRSVEFIDSLPRNPGGKVVKPELRERV